VYCRRSGEGDGPRRENQAQRRNGPPNPYTSHPLNHPSYAKYAAIREPTPGQRHAVMRGRQASVHSSSGIAGDSAGRHSCNSSLPSSELSYDAGATGVRTTSIRSAVFHVGAPTSRRGLSATKVTSDFPRAGRTRSSTATRMCRCFPTSVLDRTVVRQPGLHNRRHQRPRQDARHSNCHCRCRECSGTAHWREPLCRCGRATRTRRGRHRPGQGDLWPSARRLLARWPTSGSGEPPSLYLMATVLAEDRRV
jgi:hypothetical protein